MHPESDLKKILSPHQLDQIGINTNAVLFGMTPRKKGFRHPIVQLDSLLVFKDPFTAWQSGLALEAPQSRGITRIQIKPVYLEEADDVKAQVKESPYADYIPPSLPSITRSEEYVFFDLSHCYFRPPVKPASSSTSKPRLHSDSNNFRCFDLCDLRGAVFEDLDLSGSSFVGALLDGAQFIRCNLSGSFFWGASAIQIKAIEAERGWLVRDIRDGRASFTSCNLNGTGLDQLILQEDSNVQIRGKSVVLSGVLHMQPRDVMRFYSSLAKGPTQRKPGSNLQDTLPHTWTPNLYRKIFGEMPPSPGPAIPLRVSHPPPPISMGRGPLSKRGESTNSDPAPAPVSIPKLSKPSEALRNLVNLFTTNSKG